MSTKEVEVETDIISFQGTLLKLVSKLTTKNMVIFNKIVFVRYPDKMYGD